jgi:MFS family permease
MTDGSGMQFQPADSLKSRTFLCLLLAQFLAAFNDQAIHASAMFFAINQKTMTADKAITLMPMLFYTPWAIFCTLAGYLADRFSKRQSLVFWKVAEVGIALIALSGFWLGSVHGSPLLGSWIVLSTVFLMGTHSAFFVPAKYGAMPEILQPQLLSKGNGLLESLSFLAVILGTVCGGGLSFWFKGHEYAIGLVLVALAMIGAASSLFIQKMPAANPTRPFPTNLFKPLFKNLGVLLRSKPLALAVLAIAFFTFMVAFMRCTIYMHGQTRNPRWDEWDTSLVVGVVALGVGFGSPLAGFLSGGKVELGLVPLGAVGMMLSLVFVAFTVDTITALIACLIAIGFFTGFYIVPMFTLLQHRAPKASKGDLLATSNFINVLGAMTASVLFEVLVLVAAWSGITAPVPLEERARGELISLEHEHGRPIHFVVDQSAQNKLRFDRSSRKGAGNEGEAIDQIIIEQAGDLQVATEDEPGTQVVVGRYALMRQGHKVVYFLVQPADTPLAPVHNKEPLTRYLFLGAALMTLGILILLCRQLPDFFVRALLWLRSHGRYRLKVLGLQNLPSDGPVILATNCEHFDTCMQVVTATDRFTRFILLEHDHEEKPPWLLRYLARRTGLLALQADQVTKEAWDKALAKGAKTLGEGNLLGVTADGNGPEPEMMKLLGDLRLLTAAPVLPVYCGPLLPKDGHIPKVRRVQVVIGHPLHEDVSAEEVRRSIHDLGEWMRQTDHDGHALTSAVIPGASSASRTEPAGSHPGCPSPR